MISVLFAARRSVYKTIPGLDVWDEERDALNWPGGNPGIFHPPCRLFCALRHWSTAPESEKQLAYWSVDRVRENGGILEHPAYSLLWKDRQLPIAWGFPDRHMGYTIEIDQWHFGHPGRKRTWLYCVGCVMQDFPRRNGKPLGGSWFNDRGSKKRNRMFNGRETLHRSADTPPAFAHWLIAVAERCNVGRLAA